MAKTITIETPNGKRAERVDGVRKRTGGRASACGEARKGVRQ